MIRLKYYSVEDVHFAMENTRLDRKRALLPDGEKFNYTSQRLRLFKEKGLTCVTCGIEGSVYIFETHNLETVPHLNLYALNGDNKLVLMTKDHIQPKSKGGANAHENYATMCSPCNEAKADKLPGEA